MLAREAAAYLSKDPYQQICKPTTLSAHERLGQQHGTGKAACYGSTSSISMHDPYMAQTVAAGIKANSDTAAISD